MARQLFPFQVEDGEYISKRKSALVAHQPRVGKSNIAIRAADLLKARIVVIVCPAAVKESWRKAIEEFREGGWTALIVSYNKAQALYNVIRTNKMKIDVLVVDESHYCKERETGRTKAVFGLTCDRFGGLAEFAGKVYCLTGTPIPNLATELYPMLRSIAPELIDRGNGTPMSFSSFRDRYCKMINTPFGVKYVGSKNYRELKDKMKGFVIRRTRKEVFGRELMPPTRVYIKAEPADLKAITALAATDAGKVVLKALESSDPMKALHRAEKQAATLRKLFGLAKVPGIVRLASDELADEPDGKLVIFAYHHAVIDALKVGLKKFNPLVFDGRTSADRKIKNQNLFMNNVSHRVIIGQLDAMSVGLDLSAAHQTLFAEQSWVGSTNLQAAARIFNANSPEPKFTRFAILAGSLDDQISRAAERKLVDEMKMFS